MPCCALRIRHLVSTFSVHLRRGHSSADLAAAAARLDDTVLHPADSFSLRGRLGGAAPGGGSGTALATAIFNAAWLGGLQLGSHANLLTYSGDYPMGRDATVADGQDVAFTDNTSYGGSLTVSLWSTPTWDVVSSHAAPANVVRAERIVRHGSGCRARDGRDGFDTEVTRTFARPGRGAVDHRSSYAVHYVPVATVVCKGRDG